MKSRILSERYFTPPYVLDSRQYVLYTSGGVMREEEVISRRTVVLFAALFTLVIGACSGNGTCDGSEIIDHRFFYLAGLPSPGYGTCIAEDDCSTTVIDGACVSHRTQGDVCGSFYDCAESAPFCLSEIPGGLGDYCTAVDCLHETNEDGTECPDGYYCMATTNPMTGDDAFLCIQNEQADTDADYVATDTENETADTDTGIDGMSCHNTACEDHVDCTCEADVCLPSSVPGAADGQICVVRGCDPSDTTTCPDGEVCHEIPDFVQDMVDGAETLCYRDAEAKQ